MKKGILLITLLQITASSFSQHFYPQAKIIDSDTICLISVTQVKTINNTFVDLMECHEIKDSLNNQINTYDKIVSTQKAISFSLQKQVKIQQDISEEKDIIIGNYKEVLGAKDKKIKSLKIQRGIISSMAVIFIAIILTK